MSPANSTNVERHTRFRRIMDYYFFTILQWALARGIVPFLSVFFTLRRGGTCRIQRRVRRLAFETPRYAFDKPAVSCTSSLAAATVKLHVYFTPLYATVSWIIQHVYYHNLFSYDSLTNVVKIRFYRGFSEPVCRPNEPPVLHFTALHTIHTKNRYCKIYFVRTFHWYYYYTVPQG